MTTMDKFVEKQADNLDDACSNFDPNFPLEAGSVFFVQRDKDPLGPLKRALLRRQRVTQKLYIAGFKGAGKSTHINQLAAVPELNNKFFIVKFSIKETCDERNIDHVDLLTAIGAKVYETFTKSGGKLRQALYEEIESWGRRVEERLSALGAELSVEAQVGGGMNWLGVFFAKIVAKSKAEASIRTIIREVIGPQLTDLLRNIDLIATDIQAQTGKEALVFVDDTDKPLFDQATRLFKDFLAPLLAPNMHIVYTVPVWMCFTDDFPEIRDPWVTLLPNVKLYDRHSPSDIDAIGVATMEKFIHVRMTPSLMYDDATRLVIMKSGGVYREAARILQIAIDRAIEEKRSVVSLDNVEIALQVLRREFRRLITDLDEHEVQTLKIIGRDKSYGNTERASRLLNNSMVLEHVNGDRWPDLNPLLRDVLM